MTPETPHSVQSGLPIDPIERTLQLLLSLGREVRSKDPAKAADCFRQAAELARGVGRTNEEGHALLLCGDIEIQRGELVHADECVERALTLSRTSGESVEIALSLNKRSLLRILQGRNDEALSILREALSLTTAAKSVGREGLVRAETLETLGRVYRDRGDPGQALRYFQEALEMGRASGDGANVSARLSQGNCLTQMGNLRHRMGQFQEAVALYREALEHYRAADDRRGAAAAANNLGTTLLFQGELDEAQARLEESRALFRALGDEGSVANILSNLGTLAADLGRVEEAAHHYRESLRIHEQREDVAGQANALNNLSHLAVVRGDPEEALRCADESLAIRRRAGIEGNSAKPLFNRGQALLELERIDEATETAKEALAAAERADSDEQRAESFVLAALVEAARGRVDPALEAAEHAISRAKRSGAVKLLATTHHALAVVHLRRGDLDRAKQELARATRLLRGWEHAYDRARVLADEGRLLAKAGSFEGAVERLRHAEREFAALGNTRWRIRMLVELGAVVEGRDDAEAARYLESAHEIAAVAELDSFLAGVTGAGDGALRQDHASRVASELVIQILGASLRREPDLAACFDAFFRYVRLATGAAGILFDVERGALRRIIEARSSGSPIVLASPASAQAGAAGDGADLDMRTITVGFAADPVGRIRAWAPPGRSFSPADVSGMEVAAGILAMAVEWHLERMDRTEVHDAPESASGRFESLIGSSRAMREVYRVITQVAPSDATVLILGESGTGKELAARALHARSRRARGPFAAISCPSIPRDLIESELFGHEKGAFTGAVVSRPGKIELAGGGTLFLDEVGDMALMTQAKLLRFLQEREFQRVGGQRNIRVDVRLIAATSRDLTLAMDNGEFREDLFYRLNVVPVRMPALRERKDDIPNLVNHFLGNLTGEGGAMRRGISSRALDALVDHDWPGNVRELQNAVEYLAATCEREMIDEPQVMAALREKRGKSARPADRAASEGLDAQLAPFLSELRPGETLESRLMQLEARLIRSALEDASWNQSEAARRLGITESMIRNRMKQFGIRKPGEN